MSRLRRVKTEAVAEMRSFTRKPAAVFFTFVFPLILIAIFAVFVEADEGLFARSQAYYLPGYLGFVVVLTPLSRVGSTVARGRDHRRFERLAATPMTQWEWFVAHAAVNAAFVLLASTAIYVVLSAVSGEMRPSPAAALFVVCAATFFCGLGAVFGRLARSEDGAIAMSNGVGFPLLFLGDTFLSRESLPEFAVPLTEFNPLTPFSRGVRVSTGVVDGEVGLYLAVVVGLAVAGVVFGGFAVPWRE
ncbi:MAG: ABC transporter permease [Halobacteriota archaeon]